MIIDSKKYNGKCACGREHEMVTLLSVVESGCLSDIDKYLREFGLDGVKVAVYDENTYKATEGKHPSVDIEVILDPEGLHANEHGVALLDEHLPEKADVLIAVGSGTVHDITRYCAYKKGASFVSCPTAASVDGFCSSVAAMTWNGCKKTLTAVAPKFVLADLDVIKNAPIRMARSGFGDMIGKYIALADWKIANILTGEFYCETIAEMTREATEAVKNSAEGIVNGDADAYEKLMYGLLLSGLAMQMMGNSRPASGAEHHISHIIEMSPVGLGASSDALHGEKVGVGTLLAAKEYHRLAELDNVEFFDYVSPGREYLYGIFGDGMTDEILDENKTDCADGITADNLRASWEKICDVIEKIPTAEQLTEIYTKLGVMRSLSDIDVSEDLRGTLLKYSPTVRNRVTLMRLRKAMNTSAKMDGSKVILAAHRGDRFNCPENTMSAFVSSIEHGVDMIETDIRMTRDGELILIHDRSAKRTAGVDVNVDTLTLSEVKELNANVGFEEKGEAKIPTVREFLELIKDTDMLVNWEFKVYPKDFGDEISFEVVDKLIALLEEYKMTERSMVNSFSDRVLEYIYKKYGKKFPIHGQGIYNGKRTNDESETPETEMFDWCCMYPSVKEKGARALDYKENFDYCNEHGIIPCICIKDDLNDYKRAIDYGCRMFTSNNIEEGHKILCELGVRK